MAISFSLILLLLSLATAVPANRTHPPSQPSPPPQPPPTPPTPTPEETQETHLDNIIDALIGAGDFAGWSNLLSTADPSALPLTATFFIPGNDAVASLSNATAAGTPPLDGFLIAYHIVPQRLTFADLQKLVARTRLPTLLPAKYIVVTDSSPENFCVDGSQITHPDIFVNAAFAVHGVRKLLDDSVYGGGRVPSPPPRATAPGPPENATPTKGTTPDLPENATPTKGSTPDPPDKRNESVPGGINLRSGVSGLCGLVFMIFSISCAVLVIFKTL